MLSVGDGKQDRGTVGCLGKEQFERNLTFLRFSSRKLVSAPKSLKDCYGDANLTNLQGSNPKNQSSLHCSRSKKGQYSLLIFFQEGQGRQAEALGWKTGHSRLASDRHDSVLQVLYGGPRGNGVHRLKNHEVLDWAQRCLR